MIFWLRRRVQENFKVFRARIASESTKFSTCLELGGRNPPTPPWLRPCYKSHICCLTVPHYSSTGIGRSGTFNLLFYFKFTANNTKTRSENLSFVKVLYQLRNNFYQFEVLRKAVLLQEFSYVSKQFRKCVVLDWNQLSALDVFNNGYICMLP